MNARELNFPPLPSYTADWYALRFEPMRGTGESFTCAILIKDAHGADVKSVIRDDLLIALFGSHVGHVQNMINITVDSLKSFAEHNDPADWHSPLTGFYLAEKRAGASLTERSGVLRQAIKLSSGFAQLDYGSQEIDERPALEAAKSFIGRVRQQVAETRNDLDSYFNKPAMIVPNGSLITFGFLMNQRAAHFEMLRPSTLSTSVKFARAKLYELKKARVIVPLKRAALIVGIPHKDDLAFSDRQHDAIERELNELQQEAREDETDTLPAENAVQAADHIIDLVT